MAVNPLVTTPIIPERQAEFPIIELCATYWKFAEGYCRKDGKLTDHIGTVKRAISIIKELYGTFPAVQFGPLAYRAAQIALVNHNLFRNTVNCTGASIRRMFRWAASKELIPATVFQALYTVPGLKAGRSETREAEPIKPAAEETIYSTLQYLPPIVADNP